jgi:Oxidoreductase family, NAD-binding Rossmann fold
LSTAAIALGGSSACGSLPALAGIVGFLLDSGRRLPGRRRSVIGCLDIALGPRLRLISGRNEVAAAGPPPGYGVERPVTDWHEVVTAPEVEIVDVRTPPGTHAEIVEAAANNGKAIDLARWMVGDGSVRHRQDRSGSAM